jgi:hypothetical protein
MKQMAIHSNPFHILGATTRDNSRRIVELAEEKSLTLENQACTKARTELTNPRNRLAAEIAWLPGLSPRRAQELLSTLQADASSLIGQTNLPYLANANLLAAFFELLDSEGDSKTLSDWILDFAQTVDLIDPEDVMREINEDRAVSGFPEVKEQDVIENELAERRRYHIKAIRQALNLLPPLRIADVLTKVVDASTYSGEDHAPLLIDDLIDSYEIDTQSYLQKEAENIRKLLQVARSAAEQGEGAVTPIINRIDALLHRWDLVAEPIHLSMKARGIDHALSHELAREVRSLSVELFNERDMLNQAQHLNELLRDIFEELPEVFEKLSEDAGTLADIKNNRQKADLLDPIFKLCKGAFEATETNPSEGANVGYQILASAPQVISDLEHSGATIDIVTRGKDEISLAIMACAVSYGNKTAKWDICRMLLEASLRLSSSTEARERVSNNLKIVRQNERLFKDLQPISEAPSLSTINGIGFKLYGSTDTDLETGSYLATYYFTFFFIPIFPIRRYRVIDTGGGYKFLGKAPLRTFDLWHIAISIGIILWIFASMK